MSDKKYEILERALLREKKARKEAEKILEQKTYKLYKLTSKLKNSNDILESLLEKKDLELKGLFANIVDAYCVMDMYGNVIEINDATYRLLGYKEEQLVKNLANFVSKESYEHTIKTFNTLKKDGAIKDFKVKIVDSNKKTKYLHINASLILNSDGKPIAIQGIARDITEENNLKNSILESENNLKALVQHLDQGIYMQDAQGIAMLANKKLCELFYMPMSPDVIPGQDFSEATREGSGLFVNPEAFYKRYLEIIDAKKEVLSEELIMTDGKTLERSYMPIFTNNKFKAHLWSFKDITLKKTYDRNLEAQKQKYSNIIANMNLGLLEVDMNRKIVLANQSFAALSGYSIEELVGMEAINDLVAENKKEDLYKISASTKSGNSTSFELELIRKDGKMRSCLVSSAPNYNNKEIIIGSIGVVLDITDLKNLQNQKEILLKNLEKSNEELQEYAHIVSHDLKSPLRSIFALVTWLKEDNIGLLQEESLENISLIEMTLEKMENLITGILNYSSINSDKVKSTPVDLNVVVEDIQQILFIPEHITVNVVNILPILQGDKIRFQQLFQNLIGNAVKYIDKEKGYITIDVVERLTHYEFSIKDNGIGIKKDYYDKIFKIFNSLGEQKDSSGVGLSIVKKITELYHGDVWLESETNVGSTFFFTIKK